MSDNPESFEKDNISTLTHRRILVLMGVVTGLSSISAVIIESWYFALGILLGGLLSILNYYWMKWTLKRAFENALDGDKPRLLGVQYILRYFGIGLILTGIYFTKTIPIAAVIIGLASFALAVVIEGVIRMFSSNN